jgi:phosphohistidine phosphatase SixA
LAWALAADPETDERLAPGADSDALRTAVAERGDAVVIGHQPDCGRISAVIAGGPEPAFPPAGLAVLEL